MNDSALVKPVTSHSVIAFLAVSMLVMAVFMFYCVHAASLAPKTVWDQDYVDANNALIDFHRSQAFGVVPNAAFAERLHSLFKGHPFSLQAAHGYQVQRTQAAKIHGKNLIMAKFSHPREPVVTVAIYPLAKRQLPKTTQINHQGFLFHVYDKGLIGHVVATNFYNDFFVFGMGELSAKDLATLTLDFTNLRTKGSQISSSASEPEQPQSH